MKTEFKICHYCDGSITTYDAFRTPMGYGTCNVMTATLDIWTLTLTPIPNMNNNELTNEEIKKAINN